MPKLERLHKSITYKSESKVWEKAWRHGSSVGRKLGGMREGLGHGSSVGRRLGGMGQAWEKARRRGRRLGDLG
nr:hypothetical protein CFP56_79640 [Quercus suber]